MALITPSSEDQFPISECTVADIPQLQECWASAFSENRLNISMFGGFLDPVEVAAWYHKRAAGQFAQPEVHVFKVTDTSTGKVAAFMRWGFPHTKPTPSASDTSKTPEQLALESLQKKAEANAAWPSGTNIALCEAKFGTLDDWRDIYVEDAETYVAQLLCTAKPYQRKGLGKKLMKHILDQADREGKKAYIEATEEGYGLYEQMGFVDLDAKEIDLSAFGQGVARTVVMMRQPVVTSA